MANGHGGKREGAGRKRKKQAEVTCPEGISPIDYLYAVANGLRYIDGEYVVDDDISRKERIEAAKAVCPYLYPRLSSIDASLDVDGELTITQIERRIVDTKP